MAPAPQPALTAGKGTFSGTGRLRIYFNIKEHFMASHMRRLALPLLLSLFLTGLLLGCDSSEPEGPIGVDSITGTWRGEIYSQNQMAEQDTFLVEMNINESMTMVSGTGMVTGPPGATPPESSFIVVEGSSYLHPFLSLKLIYEGSFPGGLNGNLSDDRRDRRCSALPPMARCGRRPLRSRFQPDSIHFAHAAKCRGRHE